MAQICNATSKSTGQPCKQPVVAGSTKCRFHGGKTPKGIASPHFKTGRYSRYLPYLPERLQDRFSAAQQDPELLSLESEIALVDSRLTDLLSRVDTGEAGALWKAAQASFQDLLYAMNNPHAADSPKKLFQASRELEITLGRGAADYAAWDAVISLTEQRRKLTESRRKHLLEMEQVVTSEQAMLLVSGLLESVRRNVNDRTILSAIQAEFIQLTSGGNRQRVGSGE